MRNTVSKEIDLAASPERVWHAIADSREFGEWFRASFEAPFAEGCVCRGVPFLVTVQQRQPPSLFAYTWHPYAVDPGVAYDAEPPTRVELRLQPVGTLTRLTITEEGFERLPQGRRVAAFGIQTNAWAAAARNLQTYLATNP